MSKPTARILLDKLGSFNNGSPGFVLAARVGKVLALPHRPGVSDADSGWNACLTIVLGLLNGDKP